MNDEYSGLLNVRMKIVVLTNLLRPDRVLYYELLAKRVESLKVFLSTPFEPNRKKRAAWGSLDVTLSNNFELKATWHHPQGFREPYKIHVPYDTILTLIRERPDAVISSELGARSLNACIYRLLFRKTCFVVHAALSEHTEKSRGFLRSMLRRVILPAADVVMVNGASGARYVERLGVHPSRIVTAPYTLNQDAFRALPLARDENTARRLLFIGQLVPRKNLVNFIEILKEWAVCHPAMYIEFWIAGYGPLEPDLKAIAIPNNLGIRFVGDVKYGDLPEIYGACGILAFPTLADEWGLVVSEALAAGLPVLGSIYSQAVEEMVRDGFNGWVFRPDDRQSVLSAIDRLFQADLETLSEMRVNARGSMEGSTPDSAAETIHKAMREVIETKRKPRVALLTNTVAPYRAVVYNHIARRFGLKVFVSGGEMTHLEWEQRQYQGLQFPVVKSWGFSMISTKRNSTGVFDQKTIHVNPGYLFDLLCYRPDGIISVEMGFRSLCSVFYGILMRKPIWIWWGGTPDTEAGRGRMRIALRRMFARLPVRWISYGQAASRYLRSIGVADERIVQIQNCIDESHFLHNGGQQFAGRIPEIIYIGQLVGRKGISQLLEAACAVQRKGLEFELILVGNGPDKAQLQKYAADNGLVRVRFEEAVRPESVLSFYRTASCLVLPSVEEVWGLVVNEALWSNVPVICSRYAGCVEELVPPENTFDPLDPEEFAAVLERAVLGTLAPPDTSRLRTSVEVADMITADLCQRLSC